MNTRSSAAEHDAVASSRQGEGAAPKPAAVDAAHRQQKKRFVREVPDDDPFLP